MITPQGEAVAIDWDGASVGAPASDVGRAYYLLRSWALAPGPWDHRLIEPMRAPIAAAYLEAYLAAETVTRDEVDQWMLPMAAARSFENIPEEFDELSLLVDGLLR